MDISSVGSSLAMDALRSFAGAGDTNLKIAMAVARQAMEQQQVVAEALVKMIESSAPASATGRTIDLRA